MSAAAARTFPKKLYKLAAIQDAMEAYADFATLALERSDEEWIVTFDGADEEFGAETLASEFANYALAETIQRVRQGAQGTD
ncbi:MAG: HxsD-like protein [Myxococcota bacterium]